MYRGSLVETANADALFRDPQHPYTRALLGSVPVADPRQRRNFAATAATFSAAAAASGCIYADRCPRARERCRTESPSLERSGDGDVACFFPGAGGDLADGERQR
jgi:oligopeptide/dipeptide ABC transporter ATP-binding protein